MTTTGVLLAQLYERVIGHATAAQITTEGEACDALQAILDKLKNEPDLDDFGDFINRIYTRVVHGPDHRTVDRCGPMQWLARIQEIEAKLDAYHIKFRADYGQLQQQLEKTQEELAKDKAVSEEFKREAEQRYKAYWDLNTAWTETQAELERLQKIEARGLSLHEDRLIGAVADLSKAMAAIVPRLKDPLDALE